MLDIIIPVYKNKQGLKRTLSSINTDYLDRIKVTVVDDESNEDYTDIQADFPFITLYLLEKNSGPGVARNYGLEHSNEPYVMFIDADDYYINKNVFSLIFNKIDEFPNIEIFNWGFIVDNRPDDVQNNMGGVHGYIFKRDFLNKFNIHFSVEGSYANEDVGFINICRLMIRHLNLQDTFPHRLILETPVMVYSTDDSNSITRGDNTYLYTKHCSGTTINALHALKTAYENNIEPELIRDFVAFIILILYWNVCLIEDARPDYTVNAWNSAKDFYNQFLKNYLKEYPTDIDFISRFVAKEIITRVKVWPRGKTINVRKFIEDLSKYNELPNWYKDIWT